MADTDDQGRPEPPVDGDELATLFGFLDFQRATLEWKSRGLDESGLRATTAASSMTLAGLLKHMALVETFWFSRSLHGSDYLPDWATDYRSSPGWVWESSATDSADDLRRWWDEAVARSRALVDDALADAGLDTKAKLAWPDGRSPSLRWIVVHMIEEYSRHNGHADLLRESVDGETGE